MSGSAGNKVRERLDRGGVGRQVSLAGITVCDLDVVVVVGWVREWMPRGAGASGARQARMARVYGGGLY